MGAACSSVESVFDPLADDVVLTVEAVQVRVVQDAGAVTSSDRDLGGCAAGIEPQRQSGMPQVIRAAGERGGGQRRAEGDLAGGVPDTTIDRFAEYAAAGAAKQPPVRAGPEVEQVLAEHADQNDRDGDDADGAVGAVFEAAWFIRPASVRPRAAGARTGTSEDHLSAASSRKDEIVAA
jgi:hypothetical protein